MRTQPSQPFYDRYAYFWLPVFAVVVGVLVHVISTTLTFRNIWAILAATVVVPFFVVAGVAVAEDLAEQKYADFRSLGTEVEARLPTSTALVFDSVSRPIGSYRPGYAGYGRYTSPERNVVKAENIPLDPTRIGPDDAYVIGTIGPVLDVDGWVAIPTSDGVTLYVPEVDRRGPVQLADDLVAFSNQLEPRFGAVLRVGAAASLFGAGFIEEGCVLIDELIVADSSLASPVEALLGRSAVADQFGEC